jgi:curved DNA-binding protein
MNTGDIRSEAQARAILKLAADAPPSTWRAAFQREVKAAHPDRGGDADRVRLVIEAYRFLKLEETKPPPAPGPRPARPVRPRAAKPAAPQAPKPPPQAAPQPEPTVEPPRSGRRAPFPITIVEAFKGGDRMIRIEAGKRFKVRLPSGLQTGDVVRFGPKGEHELTIAVQPHPGAELRGADLWLQVGVSAEFLKEGGRMEVDTPLGRRQFWVSRTSAARGLFRAPGEGLPARPSRPKGHLYLRFQLDETLDQSPARSLLKRFAAAWASA